MNNTGTHKHHFVSHHHNTYINSLFLVSIFSLTQNNAPRRRRLAHPISPSERERVATAGAGAARQGHKKGTQGPQTPFPFAPFPFKRDFSALVSPRFSASHLLVATLRSYYFRLAERRYLKQLFLF